MPINLYGWEQSTGFLEEGQDIHDLYGLPEDRNSTRDYPEGRIEFGLMPPEGLVNLTMVLRVYGKYRSLDRLFVTEEPLTTFLNRL